MNLHITLTGPPGSGKTTAQKIIKEALEGSGKFRLWEQVMENPTTLNLYYTSNLSQPTQPPKDGNNPSVNTNK